MTATRITVTYNTRLNSHSVEAYRLICAPSDQEPTGRLAQVGPTHNDIVTYSGVFASRRAAIEAAASFIASPTLLIVEQQVAGDEPTVLLLRNVSGPRRRREHPAVGETVLYHRTPNGTYVSAQV